MLSGTPTFRHIILISGGISHWYMSLPDCFKCTFLLQIFTKGENMVSSKTTSKHLGINYVTIAATVTYSKPRRLVSLVRSPTAGLSLTLTPGYTERLEFIQPLHLDTRVLNVKPVMKRCCSSRICGGGISITVIINHDRLIWRDCYPSSSESPPTHSQNLWVLLSSYMKQI